MAKRKTFESRLGQALSQPTFNQGDREPSGLYPEGVEEPDYRLRGNKVICPACGRDFSTRLMYTNHYIDRHRKNEEYHG